MQTQEKQEAQSRPRRVWWIIGLTVLVVAVIGVGIWAVVAANQTSDIDVATDLVDDWIAGWNASDPEAIAAVFTEDAKEEALASARDDAADLSNVERTGDLTASGAGTFTFPARFDWGGGSYAGVWEIELGGDLVSSIEGEWGEVE
jgi:hypothetical protein